MKKETLSNLVWVIVFTILSMIAISGAIICTAWWQLVIAGLSAVMARALYTDDAYGIESVREFFKCRKSAKLLK